MIRVWIDADEDRKRRLLRLLRSLGERGEDAANSAADLLEAIDGPRGELITWALEAGPGEVEILNACARRFVGLGQRVRGPINLDDQTTLPEPMRETSEELIDGCFYLTVAALRAAKREADGQ